MYPAPPVTRMDFICYVLENPHFGVYRRDTPASLSPVNQERCGRFKESSENLLRLAGGYGFLEGPAHQLKPAVARGLVDRKGSVAHAQTRMAAVFHVPGRSAEPEDQEIPQPL